MWSLFQNLQPKPKDWVLVDEAQDLSRAQLDLVLKLPSETDRMVFVGDPQQAIFGFAGSDDQSWTRIQQAINPTLFPLSITYRCPKSHVRLAKNLVPQIEAKDDAPKDEIHVIPPQDIKETTQPGDLILCRFTAPLVGLCLKLVIHHGIPAKVRGRDIGSLLTALVKEVSNQFPRSFISDLEEYVGIQTERYEQEGRDAAIEADRVFLLKSDALPATFLAEKDWQIQQERNLLYVALTRSKGSLSLVPMPHKASQMEHLLEDPYGGTQLEESCDQLPIEQASYGHESKLLSPPIPSEQPDPEEFQIKVDALQKECQSLLWRFVQIAQAWQAAISGLPIVSWLDTQNLPHHGIPGF
ncbi:MAG: UvrD-helicase domain-containing protein [Cyanophyceae cyanobacterium]